MMLAFWLPLLTPVWMPGAAEAGLPLCCRRSGKHHCAMLEMGQRQGHGISVVAERCPYSPAVAPVLHLASYAPPSDAAVFAELVSHPAVHAQTDARYRVAFDRARQKRGPPAVDL